MLVLTIICTAVMLLMPSQSIQGAKEGISLCLSAVIPSLFPFFICSRMIVNSGIAQVIGKKIGKPFELIFGVNKSCAFSFIAGILCGYPIGAKIVSDMYKEGQCSKEEAQRMLAFCNNSGPLFIIGTVGVGIMGSARAGIILYAAHILSAVAVGIAIRFIIPSKNKKHNISFHTASVKSNFQDALSDSIKSMALVCGNIIFFSVIISAFELLLSRTIASDISQGAICGAVEIATGISMMGAAPSAFPITGFLLAWSGLSVIMQVSAIISPIGLSTTMFAAAKLMQGIFGGLLTMLLMHFLPILPYSLPSAAHTTVIVIAASALLTALAVISDKVYRSLQ